MKKATPKDKRVAKQDNEEKQRVLAQAQDRLDRWLAMHPGQDGFVTGALKKKVDEAQAALDRSKR